MSFIPNGLYATIRTYSVVKMSSVDPGYPSPTPTPHRPQMPSFNPIIVGLDEETGDLYIEFNRSMEDVSISITHCGITIDEDNISAQSGQYIIYNLDDYEEGQYILTIQSDGVVISQYSISIIDE